MRTIKVGSMTSNLNEKLNSAEIGKLWATYMGNSMCSCILKYFLKHTEDLEIKELLKDALKLTEDFQNKIKVIFSGEGFSIPIAFTEKDVNLEAPRLFEDEFYIYYLKYTIKAGFSIYNVGIPLMYRADVRDFFDYCMRSTLDLEKKLKDFFISKNLSIKPPVIPGPQTPNIANKDYLKGFLGEVRPLNALEITHLYDNLENNITSKALIVGFRQVAKSEKTREVLLKGEMLTNKAIERYTEKLNHDKLPAPTLIDHLVTTSTFSPFSDKLMLFHKVDMFSMKVRAFGNSAAVSGRHDLLLLYGKSLTNISRFVQDATSIMIENGWLEIPPQSINRENLASK